MRIAFWSFGLTGSTPDPTDDLNFEASSTSRQPREKLPCLCENVTSNNFRKTAVPKKI